MSVSKRADQMNDFLIPKCPICGENISGIIDDTDKLYCFECKVKFEMDLEVET